LIGGVGAQEGGQFLGRSFWIEPAQDAFSRKDERHTVVDRSEEVVGFDRDDGKGFEFMPAIPQASENEGVARLEMNVNGLFASGDPLPFEEAIGEDDAAFFAEGSAKSRFGGNAFGAGVDEAAADFFVLRPKGDQAPAGTAKLGATVLMANGDGGGLRGGEIIARDEIDLGLFQAHAHEELLVALGVCVTSAHRERSFHRNGQKHAGNSGPSAKIFCDNWR